MSKSKNVFITGGNRGIGLGLVEEIIKQFKPDNIFATFREAGTAEKLHALAAANPCLHLIQMDVRADEAKLADVVKTVDEKTKGTGINLLINNSGIIGNKCGLGGATKQDMIDTFEVNTVAPILIAQAFLPLLEKASKNEKDAPMGIGRAAIVNISTLMASISEATGGGYYSYRSSKAALNIATVSMSVDLKKSKILTVVLHPGWVQTDMGGNNAPTTTEQSVAGLLSVIEGLDETKNGKFYDFKGKELPW